MHEKAMTKKKDKEAETWEQKREQSLNEIGSTTVPLGGLFETSYKIRQGHDKRRRKSQK